MRLHQRQFIIGPEPLAADESWTSTAIGDDLHLSHQQALPVAEVRDRDGAVWHLLGLAVQSDPKRATPLEEIASTQTTEIDALTSTWSGRWALLGEGVLRTDVCLFGCYYARDPRSGRLLASSSAALLQRQLGADAAAPPLAYRVGMEWYPPPASRFEGIRRLLPSQILVLADDERFVRPRRIVRRRFEGTYDDTLAFLETSLRTVLRGLAERQPRVVQSLTGGYDTRVLLAATRREGLGFPTFTWDIAGQSKADRDLPPVLARDAGVPHRVIRRRRYNEESLRMFDEHTALHTADLDRELVPWDQYEELPANATIILGNLFAVGAMYFYGKLPAHPDSVVESIERAYDFARNHAESTAHRDGIRDWAEWIEAHPEPSMDWRDRFFWEQYQAGWCAAAEQGQDLINAEFISPLNCEAMLAAVLNIDANKRYGKQWEVDLTHRMAPSLTDHPYHLGGKLVDRFRQEAAAWRRHPSKRQFISGRTRSLTVRTRSPQAWSTVLI